MCSLKKKLFSVTIKTFTQINLDLYISSPVYSFPCTGLQLFYRGADKSLARPGRKQATATEDFIVHISLL